jgi:hypothetical protein
MSLVKSLTGAALAPALVLFVMATPLAAQDLVFELNNRSSYTVMEFYASPNDVGDWEQDILGEDVLPAGDSMRITIADARSQCEYDLRFVFDDGDVVERGSVDLCQTGSYTLTD